LKILLILLINFILSWSLTKLFIKPFKTIIPDIPNQRSSHNLTKPRGGGLSFILTNLITSNIFNQVNFLSLMPLGLTGFADDFYNISRGFRIVIQLTTSFFILFESNYLDFIQNINNSGIEFLLITLMVFFCTGIINFCNFMDGIDGILSGTILTFYLFAALIISNSIWGIMGGLLGFLIWNWQPSKIFMGDVGSNFLGGTLIWIILNTNNFNDSIALLFIASPILIDPFICLIRRFIAKENIFKAHNMHLYQRLNKGGLSHQKVSLIYILSMFFIGISFLLGGLIFEIITFIFVLIIGFWLEKNYADSFLKR
tara:strand:- start:2263 stop:3201 length:939 start_codon:yes stop_codon:yes gene_type:complete